jgi:Ser/Thr protein kinase RdoA (MazF antagonist)
MSLVHGMATRMVAPDWPRLTVPAVAPVLAHYPDLGSVYEIAWHSPRPFASSAIVRCAHCQVFVKRHDPRVRSVAQLREEHAFMAHLRAHGAPVPHVLAGADGNTATALDGATWEVQSLGGGADTYRDAVSWTPARTTEDARAVGRALARLHLAAEGYDAPPRKAQLLVGKDTLLRAADPLAALTAWVNEDPALQGALAGRPWQEDVRRNLLPLYNALGACAENPSWAHGDFHTSNLLWRNGAVSDVLDFGLCNRASATWDLATAIERNTIAWLDLSAHDTDIGHADLACALLQGYAEARPVSPALVHILPVVHVEFALSELAYFHAVTRSKANADAAYTDFLLGHAAWFAGRHGRAFLDHLASSC